MQYAWKPGFRSNGVSADDAHAEVERIRIESGGVSMPRRIVEAAQNPESPLHSIFEWDDATAAGRQRVNHARLLLGAIVEIRVTVEGESAAKPTRAFIRVKANVEVEGVDRRRSIYVQTSEAMSENDQRKQILRRAKREMEEWTARYESYLWLAAQVEKAETVVADLAGMAS